MTRFGIVSPSSLLILDVAKTVNKFDQLTIGIGTHETCLKEARSHHYKSTFRGSGAFYTREKF